jgi:glycosyltransferase involved in cell wall biosynthesis
VISATIIAQDEERHIGDCIASVREFCAEVLVVDGGSRDATRAIAAAAGARVLERPFDDFARQHEFARAEARGEWVLSIDADERASPQLSQVRPDAHVAAYALPFKNHYRGVWLRHGGFWPDFHLRLFRRAACRYDLSRTVHEKLIVDGPAARLEAPILHYSFESYADCLEKMTRYGMRGGEMLYASGKRAGRLDVALRPAWRFVRGFVLQAGFLDGGAGFEMAKARAHEGRVKYTRLRDLSTRGQ